MTTFLLIRHAHCDPVGRAIAGRSAGVHLSRKGQAEAETLGERLSGLAISAIYSSPLERALETAAPIAERQRLRVRTAPGLLEIDFGEWTGRSLAELDSLAEWKAFNRSRNSTRIPGGESTAEVLARSVGELDRLGKIHPEGDLVALVSHGDVLRLLITHFMGAPADLLHRIEISPGSVSILALEAAGPRLLLLNSQADWPVETGLKPAH
ncbi:MAG TPA: histidine phosphatase family protein [Gemmatimonadales bacterium]|nr:histidine phosphatase family protein [Gemmatimonadales bacterium]